MIQRRPFKPAKPERQALPFPRPVSGGVAAHVGDVVAANPKYSYIRSPALLEACRLIPCQNCGRDDGTVVAAHSNQAKHGKGRGIKASDVFVASLCSICHHAMDQGSKMSQAERERMWDGAHWKTVNTLLRIGLWPTGLLTAENFDG